MIFVKSRSCFAATVFFRMLLLTCSLLYDSTLVRAQHARLDSLRALAGRLADTDVQKADILHALAAGTWGYDLDEGLRYAQQANEVARNRSYTRGLVQSLTDIGEYYYFKGDYAVARQFYRQALGAAGAENYGDYPACTFTCLGNLYRVQASFDTARMYYQRALALIRDDESADMASESADMARARTYLGMAEWHEALAQYDEAWVEGQRSLAVSMRLNDPVRVAACRGFLGGVCAARFDFDSAAACYERLSTVARRYDHPLLTFGYTYGMAGLAYRQGEYGRAAGLYTEAMGFLKRNEYKRYRAEILKKTGQIFSVQGDFNTALEHFLNALEMNEKLNNRQEVSRINNLVAWLYLQTQSDSLARVYGTRALALAKNIGDDAGIADCYNLLGFIEFRKKDFAASLDHFTRSLQIRRQLKLGNEVCVTLFNMGRVYYEQGLYVKAMEYHERIINLDHKMIDKQFIAQVYNSLAQICIEQKLYARAGTYLGEAEALARSRGLPVQLRDSYRLYAGLSKQKGDFRQATAFYEAYTALNDSLFNSESIARVAQLGAVYQLGDKEREIRLLNQENELKKSRIAVQESRLTLQQNILITSIAGIILLAVTAYVLYMYYRSKHKAHLELTRLHQDISEKNEEIQAQSEELIEANASLSALNNRLIESQEEVQAQSEELMEANEIITSVNRDLEEKVRVRTEELKQAYIELDTFFYRSSHDFRRPLTTFLGLAEVAKITVKNENALELFEKVKDTALNLDKMLLKLQSISDVGTQQLAYKQVLLKELILNITDGFRPELDLHGIKLNHDFKDTGEFHSYPVLVKIIVENLVENAIYFCGTDNPYINIRTYGSGREVVIEVEDNGQGISDELSNRIFDMYFRANHHSKGNGLGLYIVKKAIEKISGTISFTSALYRGSLFRVTVPLHAPAHTHFSFPGTP